ncbi:hypothetical protein F5146DRAFT_1004921 [Armillaria mellea]|nr:hypothetical protein F5146DRAFT_1004921 [Armillaria mellea]
MNAQESLARLRDSCRHSDVRKLSAHCRSMLHIDLMFKNAIIEQPLMGHESSKAVERTAQKVNIPLHITCAIPRTAAQTLQHHKFAHGNLLRRGERDSEQREEKAPIPWEVTGIQMHNNLGLSGIACSYRRTMNVEMRSPRRMKVRANITVSRLKRGEEWPKMMSIWGSILRGARRSSTPQDAAANVASQNLAIGIRRSRENLMVITKMMASK